MDTYCIECFDSYYTVGDVEEEKVYGKSILITSIIKVDFDNKLMYVTGVPASDLNR